MNNTFDSSPFHTIWPCENWLGPRKPISCQVCLQHLDNLNLQQYHWKFIIFWNHWTPNPYIPRVEVSCGISPSGLDRVKWRRGSGALTRKNCVHLDDWKQITSSRYFSAVRKRYAPNTAALCLDGVKGDWAYCLRIFCTWSCHRFMWRFRRRWAFWVQNPWNGGKREHHAEYRRCNYLHHGRGHLSSWTCRSTN